MGKTIRFFIAIIVLLSLVLVARNKAAWASHPGSGADSASSGGTVLSAALDTDRDCDERSDDDHGQDKKRNKCKDKDDKGDAEDDDGEDDDEDDDNGSVQPPDDDIEVCERGEYSVGGVATVEVERLRRRGCLRAFIEDPANLPSLPNGTMLSGIVALQFPPGGARVKICFAVPPGSQNVSIQAFVNGVWKSLRTRVRNGMTCTEVSRPGAYTLVGQ